MAKMHDDSEKKLKIQEGQYEFPYHYIPKLNGSRAQRHRVLGWGFEYLCYQHHIVDTVRGLSPRSVLEVGCGDGNFIGALGSGVPHRVGADFSERAISFARAFNPDVTFHAVDAAEIDEQFDVVAAIEVLEHIPDEQVASFLRVLFERAKPGGYVLISVPSVILPLNKKHFRHYSEELLRAQVADAQPQAELVRVEHVCRVPRWMSVYDKLTVNRYWMIDIPLVSSLLWRRLWEKHRTGEASSGRHVVGLFRRPE
jgi:SAM-dependent methyltransferase